MADEPGEALQKAVYAALRASSAVTDLVETRVWDQVEGQKAAFPYITIGDDDIIDDSNSCFDAFEVFVTVHVWSRDVGKVTAKRVGRAVRAALNVELLLTEFVCTVWEHQSSRYFKDGDGLTTHGVLTFRYLLDPSDDLEFTDDDGVTLLTDDDEEES